MKVSKIYCDLCKVEEKHPTKRHWTEGFGENINLSFKPVPGIQREIKYEHLCLECASELIQVIELKNIELASSSNKE